MRLCSYQAQAGYSNVTETVAGTVIGTVIGTVTHIIRYAMNWQTCHTLCCLAHSGDKRHSASSYHTARDMASA